MKRSRFRKPANQKIERMQGSNKTKHYVSRFTFYVACFVLIGLITGLFAFPILVAQVEQPNEVWEEEDQLFEPSYLGYDDIVRAFKGEKCKMCHPPIWREWEQSMHGQAWNDPIFQEAASKIPDREKSCDPCHAPDPIMVTGIGKMPKLREANRKTGVSCLVCHMDAHGAMHGPPASMDAMFHANVTSEAHMNPTELCGTCHGQPSVPEHNQLASFKNSPAAAAGKNCVTCHMPGIKRLPSTHNFEPMPGRRHTWIGSRSVHQLKKSVDLQIVLMEGNAMIRVTNKAGHLLPGDALRTIILDVKISDTNGDVARNTQVSISASSGEDEADNRIPPGETRKFVHEIASRETIEVKLRYQLLSTTPEAEWITMAEASQVVP